MDPRLISFLSFLLQSISLLSNPLPNPLPNPFLNRLSDQSPCWGAECPVRWWRTSHMVSRAPRGVQLVHEPPCGPLLVVAVLYACSGSSSSSCTRSPHNSLGSLLAFAPHRPSGRHPRTLSPNLELHPRNLIITELDIEGPPQYQEPFRNCIINPEPRLRHRYTPGLSLWCLHCSLFGPLISSHIDAFVAPVLLPLFAP